MSDKIMFRGREVFSSPEIRKDSCAGCVGDTDGCEYLPQGCGSGKSIWVYHNTPIDVFIETGAKEYYYFTACLHCVDCVSYRYSTRRAAIRGAKRFCKSIGYECEVKK